MFFTKEQEKMLQDSGLFPQKKKYGTVSFDEETIRAIFGHEAAEDEEIDRLKRYYVKTEIYNSIRSSIPLYILVGHKGVGKSALFKILILEDNEEGNIPISIQPDDILDIKTTEENFLQRIRDWKEGLAKIIFRELILTLNAYIVTPVENPKMKEWIGNIIKLVGNLFGKKLTELQDNYLDLSNAQIVSFFKNSLQNCKNTVKIIIFNYASNRFLNKFSALWSENNLLIKGDQNVPRRNPKMRRLRQRIYL